MNTYISNSATRRPVKNTGQENVAIAPEEIYTQKKSLANLLTRRRCERNTICDC